MQMAGDMDAVALRLTNGLEKICGRIYCISIIIRLRRFTVTDIQIAVLEIAMVGGTGLIIGIIGIAVWFAQKRKTARCTEKTEGQVIRHRFRGGGRMEPVIGYRADGREYETVRTFRGVLTKTKVTPRNVYADQGAYVSEKDWLVVPMSAVTNLKKMAEDLWPTGSQMTVWYDPARPEKAFAQKKPDRAPAVSIIFMSVGAFMVLLSLGVGYLIAYC